MKTIFTCILFVLVAITGKAQSFENPGAYMTAVVNAHTDMNKKYMAYVSAVAHGRRARKIEKMRMQTLESITQSRYKTVDLPIYKGDNSLRQSSIDYIKMCYDVFNDDYSKIVDMEEIAEQSFDEMQAYILLQEKTGQKLKEAYAKMDDANKAFAVKYEVKIVEGTSELAEKMAAAGKLNRYNNQVFLIFFKCNWQDGEIVKAMNAKKLNDVEQGRSSLIKYAIEGLQILDTLKHFNSDPSVNAACKNVLRFYKKMAETELPKVTDFYLKEENFSKMKKSYEGKGDRNKEDVDAYNKAVQEINAAVNAFNQSNNNMNTNRTQVLQNWDKTEKEFNETHMPRYKA